MDGHGWTGHTYYPIDDGPQGHQDHLDLREGDGRGQTPCYRPHLVTSSEHALLPSTHFQRCILTIENRRNRPADVAELVDALVSGSANGYVHYRAGSGQKPWPYLMFWLYLSG